MLPRGPVRDRGFVVLVRNTESLQAVQRWCLQQTWNDCLAARYRIESKPVFGTLFAALSDDGKKIQADGLPGLKRYGSVLFRPDSDWPEDIRRGRFQGLTAAIDGAVSPDNMSGMLPAEQLLEPIKEMLAMGTGRVHLFDRYQYLLILG